MIQLTAQMRILVAVEPQDFRKYAGRAVMRSQLHRSAGNSLQTAIRCWADKTWTHPVTGCDVQFSAVTIERWYSTARRGHDDPVAVWRRAVRKDRGKVSLAPAVAERLILPFMLSSA